MSEENKQKLKEYQKSCFVFSLDDIIYGEKCINKNGFHKNKKPVSVNKVQTKKMFFNESLYGNKGSFKYFIEYRNETDPFPAALCINFLK